MSAKTKRNPFKFREYDSVVEYLLPKQDTRVRFPLLALALVKFIRDQAVVYLSRCDLVSLDVESVYYAYCNDS